MKYINSKLFSVQLIIQLILIVSFFLIQININTQAIISGILLCIVGIPHGSNDYIYRSEVSKLGLLKFVLIYILIILLYLVVWFYFPILALILFFIISIHHFGQSNFENPSILYLPAILWGTWVLLFPVIIHFQEALSIFNQMIHPFKDEVTISMFPLIEQLNFIKYSIIIGFILIYFFTLRYFEKAASLKYFIQFLLVSAWFLITPLIFGFIVIFCVWHSIQSIKHQSQCYKTLTNKNLRDFLIKMIPFSALALISFAVFIYFRGFNISELFILLSVITLPHVLVMHQLYDRYSVK